MSSRSLKPALAAAAALLLAAAVPAMGVGASSDVLHPGTVHSSAVKASRVHGGTGSANLTYHGGVSGSGVETGADKVYLVYWGSQWNDPNNPSTKNDPSGEAAIQQNFFNHVGGSAWNNSVTQYCQNVASGTVTCGSNGTPATNPTGVLATGGIGGGIWYDNTSAAPSNPTQSQLATEAIAAAAHFGNTSVSSNNTVQYVINTATRNSSSGFGTQFCAWHSSTSSSYGNIAYTNMPYLTDAGASCGADFVNSALNGGATDGITIVGGHEFAETETDIFPNGGWLDANGKENGDKCAWISAGQGASTNVSLYGTTSSNGPSFPVQSLWSNAPTTTTPAGCVLSYP